MPNTTLRTPSPRRLAPRTLSLLVIVLATTLVHRAYAQTQTLWYAGDTNHAAGLANGVNPIDQYTGQLEPSFRDFEDFQVTGPTGWHITEAWASMFFEDPSTVTQAEWSIRTGMAPGDGGTVVAQGVSGLSLTPTGLTQIMGYPDSRGLVQGLDVDLAPGTYWLQVSPIGRYSSLGSTDGANAVGNLTTDPALAYSPALGFGYSPFLDSRFSMGVGGSVLPAVPESSPLLLLALGVPALVAVKARRKK